MPSTGSTERKECGLAFSIKDLARAAGVSVTTVTRALQDKPDVSPSTRKKVLDLAERHNYRPNILARSLVTSRTFTVGVIVPDLMNPFFPALIKGIESTLWARGYSVILADTNSDAQKERRTVDEFISRRVDGLIMSPIETEQYQSWIGQIRGAALPFVSLTRLANHDADTVIAADRYGARSAAEHLLAAGRSHIAYVGNGASRWANAERIAGIREAHATLGVPFQDGLVQDAQAGTMDSAREATRRLLTDHSEVNAIIAFDDLMALGVRSAVTELRLRVPEDVALVGFDNIDVAALPEIGLTTVDIPKIEIGRVSAQLVVERIEEMSARDDESEPASSLPFKEIVLNTHLVVRGTTAT